MMLRKIFFLTYMGQFTLIVGISSLKEILSPEHIDQESVEALGRDEVKVFKNHKEAIVVG